ncbi:MAG: nucleotidyl transferase AbiEii/AbiGii toxin family protein [bacterium]|nr:nucleotidyl transferase AbiEii/AbiGii toxin family protein [bacterium]
MKSSTQLKALIRNLSKEKRIEAHILMRNYMLERFLERVSLSPYKHNFILKGGMLVSAMVGIDARATMDMDATIRGYNLTEGTLRQVLEAILAVSIDDEVQMTIKSIGLIHEESQYGGLRVSIETLFDGVRTPLKIDITTGDKITPKEITYKFELMFEKRSIDILAYNLETVLAEKLDTAIARGITNTRMRDFYDIHILQKLYSDAIDYDDLEAALLITSNERGTSALLPEWESIISEVSNDKGLQSLWKDYQRKFSYAADISWDEIVSSLNLLWDKANRSNIEA